MTFLLVFTAYCIRPPHNFVVISEWHISIPHSCFAYQRFPLYGGSANLFFTLLIFSFFFTPCGRSALQLTFVSRIKASVRMVTFLKNLWRRLEQSCSTHQFLIRSFLPWDSHFTATLEQALSISRIFLDRFGEVESFPSEYANIWTVIWCCLSSSECPNLILQETGKQLYFRIFHGFPGMEQHLTVLSKR